MKKKVVSGDVTAVDLMMEMLAFPSIRTVSEKLALVLTHTTKPEKEVELNQLQYQIIKNDLSNLGFLVKTSIDQNDFCMFGKSLPDHYFYKDHSGNIVKAGLLKKICSSKNWVMKKFAQLVVWLNLKLVQMLKSFIRRCSLIW